MNYNLSDILLNSNSKEEKDYCQKHNIELNEIDNGIKILGISCDKDFTSYSNIKFEFSEGAYGNKPGTVHFLEHFFNKKIHRIADKNNLKINAFTNQINIWEEISGVTNPDYRNYGIWTILKELRMALESPLSTMTDTERQIEAEKKVIKSELGHRIANHDVHVQENLRRTVFSSSNPLLDVPPVIGLEEDIDGISFDDLKKAEEKILIPRNLLISCYAEGNKEVMKSLTTELIRLFKNFPRAEKAKNNLNQDSFGQINSQFKPGKSFSYDTNLKNGIVTTEYVWVLNNPLPDLLYFAAEILRNIVDTEIFDMSRKYGWGYKTNVYLDRPNDKIAVFTIRIDSRKDMGGDYHPAIKSVLSNVFTLSSEICKLEILRQNAVPLSQTSRLSWAVGGIKKHGNIIDADTIRGIKLKVEAKHVNKLAEELLNTKPVRTITGDLN